MPEGPEIWRVSDRLSAVLADREAKNIFFAFDRLKQFEEELLNIKVKSVEPRGKAILTRFENGLNIYSHNQLYGKWKIEEKGERPDTNRKLRLAIENAEHSALLYSASQIEVLNDEELNEHGYLEKLGPDVLHPETDYKTILERYQNDTFQNRKVATLLLDQGFLSGLGNYLRAEIMFVARVHPDLKLRECTPVQKEKLAEASIELPHRSYETGGITTDSRTVEALKRENSERWNYRHYVYNREDAFCHKCGAEIQVHKTGGRKLYYCPDCQEKFD